MMGGRVVGEVSGNRGRYQSKAFLARFSLQISINDRQISVILDYILTVSENEYEISANFGNTWAKSACFSLFHSILLEGAASRGAVQSLRRRKQKKGKGKSGKNV